MSSQTAFGYAMPTQSDTDPSDAAEKQKRRVEDYYRYKFSHIRWAGVFIDGPASAHTPLLRRKAGGEMLKRAERGDHIILSSLSIAFHTHKICYIFWITHAPVTWCCTSSKNMWRLAEEQPAKPWSACCGRLTGWETNRAGGKSGKN